MSGIEIQPVDGGNKVKVPKAKTNVGRGPLLQITDKKVSRNHATIEINDKGEMVLTPIHSNPCFFKAGGEGDKAILPKDKPKVLSHNDVFGLLPDKLFFKVVYLDQVKNEKKVKKEVKEEEESATDATDDGENDVEATPKKKKSPKYKDMALPLEKTRKLPKWMVGAGKRTAGAAQSKATPTKPAKPKVAANAKVPKKPAPTPTPKRSRRKVRDDDDDDDDDDEDYEEEVKKPGRRPRAVSQRKPKYKEDFVVSGSDLNLSDSSDDEPQKKDDEEDSDFSIDDIDNDSGSDWGAEQKKASTRSTPSRKGRGRGKRRASATKRRRGSDSDDFSDDSDDDDNYVPRPSKRRAPARKKKQESESEESEESEEEVKPKRKTARRRKKDLDSEEEVVRPKRKAKSESEESEESEEEVKPKRKTARRRKKDSDSEEEVVRPKRKAKRKKESEEEEEEEEEKEEDDEEETKKKAKPQKKKRKRCMFGKKCYRKNPVHMRDYCHPGDRSFDEIDSEDEEVLRRRTGGALREKDKRSILHRASDDDGEQNTYDYKDSFLDDGTVSDDASSSAFDPNEGDSDYDPEAEEDLAALKREAKGFLRNKRLQKPVRHK